MNQDRKNLLSTDEADDDGQHSGDPYLWLEDIQGCEALEWVRKNNAASRHVLEAHDDFEGSRHRLRAILDSPAQIPYVYREGEFLINFWRDENHPKGLWRRTPLTEYWNQSPRWEILLDLDMLAHAEDEDWVWEGAHCLGGASTRCLVSISRGGADAVVVREFDTATKAFVNDGFFLPEAKSTVAWLDRDRVFVSTDFGAGSLTDAGYPRVVKLWRRGQTLSEAITVFEGEMSDVVVEADVDHTPDFKRVIIQRTESFYTSQLYLWSEVNALKKIDKPDDAKLSFWREHVLIELRSDWAVSSHNGMQTWPSGSLLVCEADAFLHGRREFTALFSPTTSTSLVDFSMTRSHVLLNILDHVVGRGEAWHFHEGVWRGDDIVVPGMGTLDMLPMHDPQVRSDPWAEHYFLNYADFVTPDSLYLRTTGAHEMVCVKFSPAFFDATNIQTQQYFAISKDGTKVPYFLVGAKDRIDDGGNPTLLYGYGGFEACEQPRYAADYGSEWLAKGGVLVIANIRGGGEYGPGWHQAAVTANKQRSFDDFVAVAQDLIARKVTSPSRLGIQGGSNGGLLVAVAMVQCPELFNAVVCQVPLLDMYRYHTLLAGASWMAEYGNPDDPQDRDIIAKYSPYQNVASGAAYPAVFFTTSTRDDRVHPGHARKMAAKMAGQGHRVLYYENTEGGHGGAANNLQSADLMALEFAFLWQQLGR